MLRKIFFIPFVLTLFSMAVEASFTSRQQQVLFSKLSQITALQGEKIGLAFVDFKTGWKLHVNGSQEFPAASVAKVPVMAAAYHLADLKKLDLERKILFRESDKLGGSGVLRWMRGGRTYTLRNLIRLMIVLSDNTATRLVVNSIGTPEINSYLYDIGLNRTRIVDPTMLKEPPVTGINLTTPLETAHLLARIYSSEGFSAGARKEMLAFMRNQRYRWGIWRGVSPGTVVADKTGNLEGVLNDAGIVYTKSGDYILSIFTQGFKRQREARLLINEISQTVFEEYTGEKVKKAEKTLKRKKTWKGKKAVKSKRQKVIRRKLQRRPSGKSRRWSGHHGAASGRKLQTYRRR